MFLLILGIAAAMFFLIISRFINLWFQAFVSGTPIAFVNIIGMSLRKIPTRLIVTARINLFKAGLKSITVSDLETHYMAGGRVNDVVRAMIAADKANIPLDWRQATAIDLAGRDIFEAVKTSVNPKVIDCPPIRKTEDYISAVAKDGIELKCRARVTVRTNINQLVGGATEETIIARVGEGIVSAIGSSDSYQIVLESPQRISKLVLEKGLDAKTAYQILSIDISELKVAENISARLQAERAETDVRIARAEAEKRRAMAVAFEQEYIAKVREAEVQVPLAIAEAFRKGNLGVMDYQRIKNIQADTSMRESISKPVGSHDAGA
ncbi:MAG: flotillin-like protein FloA [Chlamydiota bacterium]